MDTSWKISSLCSGLGFGKQAEESKMKGELERACAKADKNGKIIRHFVASFEWEEREMRKLGLNPKSGIDKAFFKEINE